MNILEKEAQFKKIMTIFLWFIIIYLVTIIGFIYFEIRSYNKPNSPYRANKAISILEAPDSFHEDFDSSYVLNESCVTYTFKKNHICKQQ